MKLSRITLVNWYKFNPIDIEIRGNTALIGINGTGKSTILDAVQTVLFGGNKNFIKYNAKAQKSGIKLQRTTKTYCLGPGLRTSCYSYLALTFEGKYKLVNLMLAIEARESEPNVEFKAYAIGNSDRALSCEDFITRDGGKYKTLPFSDIFQHLKLRGFNFTIFQNPKEYITNMARELGPNRLTGETIDPSMLSSTLSRSLAVGENIEISEFAKSFILEERPLNVSSMINARQQYLDILKQLNTDKDNLDRLEVIRKKLKRSLSQLKKSVSLNWYHFENESGRLEIELETLREQRHESYKEYLSEKEKYQDIVLEIQKTRKAIKQLEGELAGHEGKTLYDSLSKDIKGYQAEQQGVSNLRLELFNALDGYVHDTDKIKEYVLDCDTSLLTELNQLISDIDKINAEKVDPLIQQLPPVLSSIETSAAQRYVDVVTACQDLEQRQATLVKLISDAQNGINNLSPKTSTLIQELANNGIKAKPICQLATITDKRWQPVIESLLGGNTEALIVDKSQEKDAIRVYRNMRLESGRDLYNLTIVRTSRCHNWLNNYKKGSAAELVESNDERALAFLHQQLGQFMLVDTEEELKKEERAITDDGMMTMPSKTTRIKLSKTMQLIEDVTENIPIWETEQVRNTPKLENLRSSVRLVKAYEQKSRKLLEYIIDEKRILFIELNKKISRLGESIKETKERQNNIDLTGIQSVEQKIKENKKVLELLDGEKGSKTKSLNKLSTLRTEYFANRADCINIDTNLLMSIEQAKQAIEVSPFYDPQFIDEMDEKFKAIDDIQGDASIAKQNSVNAYIEGKTNLEYYLNTVERFIEDDFDFSDTNLVNMIDRVDKQYSFIKEISLAQHQESANKAVREMNESFRADIINKLKGIFDELSSQFNTINKSLKKYPFAGSRYQFKAYPKAEFKKLIDYIKSVSENESDNTGDLFDKTPDSIKEEIDNIINFESSNSPLEDYREYFDYDVEIENLSNKTTNTLSNLVSTGSVGELQSPFYVTLASALSTAWKTLKHPGESVGLTLLDEAFNNLSEDNLISAKTYMAEVGLQLLIAAPSDKEPTFNVAMDTIHYISKEGDAVDITTHYITERGKEILTASNPNLNSDLVYQKMKELENDNA